MWNCVGGGRWEGGDGGRGYTHAIFLFISYGERGRGRRRRAKEVDATPQSFPFPRISRTLSFLFIYYNRGEE